MVKRFKEQSASKLPPCACARCFGPCYRCQILRPARRAEQQELCGAALEEEEQS